MAYDQTSEDGQTLHQNPWERFVELPPHEQLVVEALKGVELQQQEIRFQYQLELLKLKQKYNGILSPLYQRRKTLVNGQSNPSDFELDAGERGLRQVFGTEFKPPTRNLGKPARIDNFWIAVLMNHPAVSQVITATDHNALSYLVDIRVTYIAGDAKPTDKLDYAAIAAGKKIASAASDEKTGDIGYTLSFDFAPNPFFENSTLEKTYWYKKGEVDGYGEFLYAKSVGCTIYWKHEQNLIGDHNDDTDMSFFNFFSPTNLPSEAEIDMLSDEEFSDILDEVEGDFACGEDIRDEIIPYSLMYLLDPHNDGDSEDDWVGDGTDDSLDDV